MRGIRSGVVALVCVVLLSSCALVPFGPPDASETPEPSESADALYVDPGQKMTDRMQQIVAAVNDHDAPALKAMFSTGVLNHTPEIARGLDYLLSLFPKGGITWTQDPAENTPVEAFTNVEAGKLKEWVHGNYRLSVEGHEYWLYFADATVNEVNPHEVGLERLGVTPWVGDRNSEMSGPAAKFYEWVNVVVSDPNFEQSDGIYVPQ